MSKWRDQFEVHPAADVFPMMSDEELAELGGNIKQHGLLERIKISGDGVLLDGRNRLEAAERASCELYSCEFEDCGDEDPLAVIISANIHRRHLTKQQQADLIVAAVKAAAEASRQGGEVPLRHVKGKAGSAKDEVKAKAVANAEKIGISQRTVKRSFAKAEGKTPNPKPKPQPKATITVTMPAGIDAARKHYVLEFVDLSPAKRRAEWDKLLKAVEKAADEASS
jgi:ParB-like chromosome segregation protein Spo0J